MLFVLDFAVSLAFMAFVQGQDEGNVFKPIPLTPGPWVKMSHGEIWPRPASRITFQNYFVVDDPKGFHFNVSNKVTMIIVN